MSVVIVLYFLPLLGVQGFPVPHVERAPSSCDSDDLNGARTIWRIIWSCLATIFAATWISAHPNIPEPQSGEDKSKIAMLKRRIRDASPRLQIMVTGLLAPELVIIWAYRQNRMAAKLATKYKGSGWTMSHGFFAIMGGFMFYNGKKPLRTFTPKDFDHYFLDKIDILPQEIGDKSKGDFLSKAIAIGQTGWFVVQCVARRVAGLPLTDLELVTLSFAVPNIAIYAILWFKPIDVRQPYRVPDPDPEKGAEELEVPARSRFWAISNASWHTIRNAAYNLIPTYPASTLERIMHNFMEESGLDRDMGGVDLGDVKKVPIWYAGDRDDAILQEAIRVGVFIATIFGGIHCVGWSFEFPTRAELLLWRLSSLAITCVPLIVFTIYHFGSQKDGYLWRLLGAMVAVCVLLYFLSRMAIMVLAFSALRSLPQTAYREVSWRHVISPT